MEPPPTMEVSARPSMKRQRRDDAGSDGRRSNENSSDAPAPEFVDVDHVSSGERTLTAEPLGAVGSGPQSSGGGTASMGSGNAGSGFPVADQRRMKQPTLAIYGMVSDTAALKKELLDRDAQIEELTERTRALEGELARRGTHIDFIDTQLQKTEGKLDRFQVVMRAEMLRAAKQGRAEARRLLHQRHFELGQIATWPAHGREVWVEGNIMRDLILQLDDVVKRRDEAEALKKAAQSALKQLTRLERDREDSSADPAVPEALMTAQTEVQLRAAEHAAWCASVTGIKQRQAELENEKKAFLKEIRRVNDEDASEFLAVPTIGDGDRYVLMHLLGKGGFSEVWKAFDLLEGQYVACKIHRINREWPAQTRSHYLRHAERELEIMRGLDHAHLTRLFNVFQLSDTMFVSVMEYSLGMDLDTYLKRYGAMREADARLVLLQAVAALRYLASLDNPIIHYDLKPANILLDTEDPSILEIKITDFGLSKIVGPTREGPSNNPSIELTSQGTGTYWYLPPECFETSSTPRISSKVDIWSVGVIFYQMLFGRRPFAEGESQRNIWQNKLIISSARTLTFPDSPKVSDEAKELMTRCLAFNVSERYDVFQLSQDPYLYRTSRRTKTKSVAPSPTLAVSAGVQAAQPPTAQGTSP